MKVVLLAGGFGTRISEELRNGLRIIICTTVTLPSILPIKIR